MKIVKVLTVLLILTTLTTLFCGCLNTGKSVEEQAVNYMIKKYNEEFVLKETSTNNESVAEKDAATKDSATSETTAASKEDSASNIYLYSKDHPGRVITVYVEKDGSKYNFTDNYYGILKEDEYDTKLREITQKVFEEHKVYFTITTKTFDETYVGRELSDVMKDEKTPFDAVVKIFVSKEAVKEKDYEKKCEELSKLLKEENFSGNIQVCYSSLEMFNKVNKNNYLLFSLMNKEDITATRIDL